MKASEGIKTFVEHKIDGVWQRVANEMAPPDPPLDPSWNLYRNFELFGLLADVDTKRFDNYIPPRGLPEDVSSEVKALWEAGKEAHTPSFWTLPELIECGTKGQNITALVDMENYQLHKKGELPKLWGNPRGSYKVVDNKYMDRVIRLANLAEPGVYYTEITFEHPLKLVSERLWNVLVPAMQKLDEDVSKVRMVFWFEQ